MANEFDDSLSTDRDSWRTLHHCGATTKGCPGIGLQVKMTCARDNANLINALNIASDNKRSSCSPAIESAPNPRKLQAPAAFAVSNARL